MGNLIATIPGREGGPSVMLFTHMDQLGLVVRSPDGMNLDGAQRLGPLVGDGALEDRREVVGDADLDGGLGLRHHAAITIVPRRRAGPRPRRHRDRP